MNEEHIISDDVLDKIAVAIGRGNNRMAYNNSLYFIDASDVYLFENKDSAYEFADNNVSDSDRYVVMYASSIADVLRKIPYGQSLNKEISNSDANGLYNRDGNAFTDALIDHIEQLQLSNNKNTNVMNEQNFEYLKDNIKYMGFGEGLTDELENNVKQGKAEFSLNFKTEVNKKPFEAELHFRKPDNSEMYFFNSYRASLQKSNGENVDQTFYLNKGKGVTAKEAYNMLEGRSVLKELSNKDNVPYKAWVQLDFDNKDKHNNHEVKQFHENYGYDVKAAVSKYAVADLNDPEKEKALIQSLQKGNIQSVSIEKEGVVQKMFIEANPQFKSVNLYDGQMRRVMKEGLDQYKAVGQEQGKEAKQDQKKDVKEEIKKAPSQKAQELNNSKKKTTRKGMSV
ncbi:hypothetical protein FW778_14175 [Ginsengibacter hankyongi]|uniref:DUF3945 domain-containing protein n=1 Tax=Ginsengibacter hankyongi TaxID=2607284 RepID=A0A5J5IHU7_9BACT|nr:hypothetical protein [Ginsengibacter hankyongi]KAA9038690.1 hypothetical protein FW778_14175 [Ginsengibacter hankyongi]